MHIDANLIKSCLSKDRGAQKQMYILLLPYLRAIAKRYLRDPSYIKDALQESYVKIFGSMDKYDSEKAPFKQWAARITINSCINYNKRVIGTPKVEFLMDKHDKSTSPMVTDKLSKESLLFVLKQMPEGYFEIFNLYIIDGYSHKEIAALLNISIDLSKKRLSRARDWVRKIFNEKDDSIIGINLSSLSFFLN